MVLGVLVSCTLIFFLSSDVKITHEIVFALCTGIWSKLSIFTNLLALVLNRLVKTIISFAIEEEIPKM